MNVLKLSQAIGRQSEIQRINSRGHANGSYAQSLQRAASARGLTMAELWQRGAEYSAFNVPAMATRRTSASTHYRFLDGSTVVVLNSR